MWAATGCEREDGTPAAERSLPTQFGPLIGEAAEAALNETAELTLSHWIESDAQGVAELFVDERVQLTFTDVEGDGLRPDQATRVLMQWFDRYRVVRAEADRVFITRQNPSTGFFEFDWHVVASGTTEVLEYSVFFGCEIVENQWRISRISVLEPAV